jgi:hypothetical protein
MLLVQVRRQPGDLRVLRGVIRGFSEEARTRGFPSPSFDRFGFFNVVSDFKYSDSQAILWIVPMAASRPESAVK